MPDLPISYFPIAERQYCSEALQKLCADPESTLGFVPNVICAFAWREPRFWTWWAHRNDLMTPSAGRVRRCPQDTPLQAGQLP